MMLGLVSFASLLVGVWIRGRFLPRDRRLGQLGTGANAEAARAARLVELGEAGTYKVYNCGEILHVDYERRVMIVARRPDEYVRPRR